MEIKSVFNRIFDSGDTKAKGAPDTAEPDMSIEDKLARERNTLEKEHLDIGTCVADHHQALKSVEHTTKTLNIATYAGFGAMAAAAFLGTHIPGPVVFFLGGMVTAAISHLATMFTVGREANLHTAISEETQRMHQIGRRLDEISQEEEKVKKCKAAVTELSSGINTDNDRDEAISEGDNWIEIQGLRLEKKKKGALHYFSDLFGEIEKPAQK